MIHYITSLLIAVFNYNAPRILVYSYYLTHRSVEGPNLTARKGSNSPSFLVQYRDRFPQYYCLHKATRTVSSPRHMQT